MRNTDIKVSPQQRFAYSLRVSPRAKRARLQINPCGGLEVVIPSGFPKKAVPDLVNQHAEWILRQLQKQPARESLPVLPTQIHLTIDDSRIDLVYAGHQPSDNKGSNHLFITGTDYQVCVDQLRQWIRQKAWELLPPMLEEVSQRTGLDYRKINIRSQKTRWGSCSSSGTISLNDQLLFVAHDSVEYLMIHELCHTRHMNHSPRFWGLVEHHCPDFRDHETALNQAKSVIPDWFLRDIYA